MKRIDAKSKYSFVLAIILLLSANHNLFSQRTCGTMDHLEREIEQNPDRLEYLETLESTIKLWNKNLDNNQRNSILTIPVVVHVVFNTAAQNITDEQVLSQIEILNEDFRRMNEDADNTWSQAVDCQIEFCLATSDINGHATTGITRTETNTTSFTWDDAVKLSATGGLDPWSTEDYLNIWVCPLQAGLLGYAQLPGGDSTTDGVVIRHQSFGNMVQQMRHLI